MKDHFAPIHTVSNLFAVASEVSWSVGQETSMPAVSWCGQRISGGNSAVSSRLQRSRYSASASCLTVQPVRHKYRAASRSLEITHHGSRSDRTRHSPARVCSGLPGWGSPCVMT